MNKRVLCSLALVSTLLSSFSVTLPRATQVSSQTPLAVAPTLGPQNVQPLTVNVVGGPLDSNGITPNLNQLTPAFILNLTASVSGGAPPYSYLWDSFQGIPSSTQFDYACSPEFTQAFACQLNDSLSVYTIDLWVHDSSVPNDFAYAHDRFFAFTGDGSLIPAVNCGIGYYANCVNCSTYLGGGPCYFECTTDHILGPPPLQAAFQIYLQTSYTGPVEYSWLSPLGGGPVINNHLDVLLNHPGIYQALAVAADNFTYPPSYARCYPNAVIVSDTPISTVMSVSATEGVPPFTVQFGLSGSGGALPYTYRWECIPLPYSVYSGPNSGCPGFGSCPVCDGTVFSTAPNPTVTFTETCICRILGEIVDSTNMTNPICCFIDESSSDTVFLDILSPSSSSSADFSISATSPPAVNVEQSASTEINVHFHAGFAGPVTLTDNPLPPGLTCSLSPLFMTASGTASLSCNSSTANSYNVTITGTDYYVAHNTTATFKFAVPRPKSTSTLTVACSANAIQEGTSTVCQATAAGDSPSGEITFSSNSTTGIFTPSSAICTLNALGTCSVTYTDMAPSNQSVLISAKYPGDSNNTGATGTFSISITKPPNTTTPQSTILGLGPMTFYVTSGSIVAAFAIASMTLGVRRRRRSRPAG